MTDKTAINFHYITTFCPFQMFEWQCVSKCCTSDLRERFSSSRSWSFCWRMSREEPLRAETPAFPCWLLIPKQKTVWIRNMGTLKYYNSAYFIFIRDLLFDSTEITSVEAVENGCALEIKLQLKALKYPNWSQQNQLHWPWAMDKRRPCYKTVDWRGRSRPLFTLLHCISVELQELVF